MTTGPRINWWAMKALKAQKPRMRGGVMDGSAMGNWACIYDLSAAHARALIALISMHHMPYHDSTYSENNSAELPLGSACHVIYSSTTLVYIASLSSTLAAILISAAVVLFGYSLARAMANDSDNDDSLRLPSPFQLQVLISIIDNRLTALWSYLLYICGRKQRKIGIAPMLRHAVIMLTALVLFS